LVSYFENNAYQPAVVKFWFWIKNQNCETIIIKIVCKFVSNVLLCTQCCELKVVHQKQFHHFIFWLILTIRTSFSRELSHSFDFLFKIKIRPLQLNWHCFKSTKPELDSVQSVIVGFISYCWISMICMSFWWKLFHKSEHVSEIRIWLSWLEQLQF
jgi:hypothetical protein